jgi:hypothetical protein
MTVTVYNNERATISMIPVIGLLMGFLVVGIIGIFIGDTMIHAANQTPMSGAFAESQKNITATFELGVALAKIIVLVAVAAITFALLGFTGIIPSFHTDMSPRTYTQTERREVPVRRQQPTPRSGGNVEVHRGRVTPQPVRLEPAVEPAPAEHEPIHTRWEELDLVSEEDIK